MVVMVVVIMVMMVVVVMIVMVVVMVVVVEEMRIVLQRAAEVEGAAVEHFVERSRRRARCGGSWPSG